jgi:hypothetical protein
VVYVEVEAGNSMSSGSSARAKQPPVSVRRMKASVPSASSLRDLPEVHDWSKARRNPYVRGRRPRLHHSKRVTRMTSRRPLGGSQGRS